MKLVIFILDKMIVKSLRLRIYEFKEYGVLYMYMYNIWES